MIYVFNYNFSDVYPSLRALFGTDGMQNATHGSDCVTSAEQEISIIFGESDEALPLTNEMTDRSVKDEDVAIDEPLSDKEDAYDSPAKNDNSASAEEIDNTAVDEQLNETIADKAETDHQELTQEKQHTEDVKIPEVEVEQEISKEAVPAEMTISKDEETDISTQVVETEIQSKIDTTEETCATGNTTTISNAEKLAKNDSFDMPKMERIDKSGEFTDITHTMIDKNGKDDIKIDETCKPDLQSNKVADKLTDKAISIPSTESRASEKSTTKSKATVTKQASGRTTTAAKKSDTTRASVKKTSATPAVAKTGASKTTGTVRKTTKASSTTTSTTTATATRHTSPPTSETARKTTATQVATARTVRSTAQKPADAASKTSTLTTKRSTTGLSRASATTAATVKKQGAETASAAKKSTTTARTASAASRQTTTRKSATTAGKATAKRVTRSSAAGTTARKPSSSTEKDPRLVAARAAKSAAAKSVPKPEETDVHQEQVAAGPEPEKPTSIEIERVVQESSAKTEVHDKEVESITVNNQQQHTTATATSSPKMEHRPESDGKVSAASSASRPRTPEVAQLRSKFENLQNNSNDSASSVKRAPMPITGGNRVKDMISRFNE